MGRRSLPPPSQPSASRQRVWDAPKIEASIQSLWDLAISDGAKARLLAISCAESGAWLNALPLSSIGLRMDDDVVRIAVGLRLGLPLCSAHTCSGCGGDVLEDGIHGLSCRYSRGRHSRHAALNDIVKHSLDAAKIPSHLEPSGLYRVDGKRPDGASVVPWQKGKILVYMGRNVLRRSRSFTLHTGISLFENQGQWLQLPKTAKGRSIHILMLLITSSLLRWRPWVCSVARPVLSFAISRVA